MPKLTPEQLKKLAAAKAAAFDDMSSTTEPEIKPKPGFREATIEDIKKFQEQERKKLGAPPLAVPSTFKKGGVVKKTGLAKVHKGEVVVPAKKVKQSEKSIGAWVKSRNKKGYK